MVAELAGVKKDSKNGNEISLELLWALRANVDANGKNNS